MAFSTVSLIATSFDLNEARIGEGNSVSNPTLLNKQGLVSNVTPECPTIGETPGNTIVKSLFDGMIYCGALTFLTIAKASAHVRISAESSDVLDYALKRFLLILRD